MYHILSLEVFVALDLHKLANCTASLQDVKNIKDQFKYAIRPKFKLF
ncbi:hypothetical protein RT0480 [Rickettsia typhi str. Wilmington]|uniref:Uncharacterized protein n=1 Tax=Rickettsia typhi (strain ATCC VR-144 / Wilmington) TaxID=257363 RepID=Q68WP0_RICTY|nr:hypothetical protein RT0480 [Rickettsia typhi str. Wilmington]